LEAVSSDDVVGHNVTAMLLCTEPG